MGFIMFLARKIQLQNTDNNIQYQLTSINSQIQDLQSYASILAQDSVSINDIASIPTSLFGSGLSQLTALNQRAAQIAGGQYNQALSMGMFGQTPDQQLQYIAQLKMYENARKELQKGLSRELNEKEKGLQNKKTRLETQDKICQQELQAIDQQIASGIKNQVSSFGVQG